MYDICMYIFMWVRKGYTLTREGPRYTGAKEPQLIRLSIWLHLCFWVLLYWDVNLIKYPFQLRVISYEYFKFFVDTTVVVDQQLLVKFLCYMWACLQK